MKLLKKLTFFIVIVAALLLVCFWVTSIMLKPKYSGQLELPNLKEEVTVYYDGNGVPHINAQDQEDAYRAFGYVHAQDRLWQMELIRRIAAGRLSEVFGETMVKTDMFFSSLGIEEAASKTISNLDKTSKQYKLAKAYLDGVNEFIENGATPIEYYLLGLEKEKFTERDMYNVFGYMSFSFASAHKVDPFLTEVQNTLGNKYVEELGISPEKTTLMHNARNLNTQAQFAAEVHKIMETLPVPSFMGSNSWVLGPEKTKNGKVIFANDPHISSAQPGVWFQNHIKTPDFEMYGFNLALSPFPLLGHNTAYAYGLTMLQNDDIDFYIEENNPNNDLEYKTSEGFLKYELRNKTIKVKNGEDTLYQIRVSKHGPIINDVINQIESSKPIAMQWAYTQLPNDLLDVSYGLSHATSLLDFRNTVSKIHAPGLNVMYGDAKDNIAWFASAKLYKHRDSLNTKLFLDGASGKDEIIGYHDFSENPQAINPEWNFVYSANNQPDSIGGRLYPGYYSNEDRAKRIKNILESKDDFTKEDIAKMIHDVNSVVAVEVIQEISKVIDEKDLKDNEKEVFKKLKDWDGTYMKDYVAPTIYNRFMYEFYKGTYADELGKDLFELFLNAASLKKKCLSTQISRQESVWWDNVKTKEKKEGRKDILTQSIKNTVTFLENQLGKNSDEWQWKRVFSMEHGHAIGKAGGLLRKYFNVGPFEVNGGDDIINKLGFKLDSTGVYKVSSIPSSRRVVDFSAVDKSLGMIPTGQSGNRFSPHYKDQAEKYVNEQMDVMLLNEEQIKKSKNKLVFKPKN